MSSLHIVRYNVRGIQDKQKQKELFQYFRDRNTNIVMLQETQLMPKYEALWRNEWGGSIFYSHGQSNAHGVCILTKNKHFKLSKLARDSDGKILCIQFDYKNTTLVFCNVYAPNDDNLISFSNLFKIVDTMSSPKLLVVGYFNLILKKIKGALNIIILRITRRNNSW